MNVKSVAGPLGENAIDSLLAHVLVGEPDYTLGSSPRACFAGTCASSLPIIISFRSLAGQWSASDFVALTNLASWICRCGADQRLPQQLRKGNRDKDKKHPFLGNRSRHGENESMAPR
jgi:hypothetical protein